MTEIVLYLGTLSLSNVSGYHHVVAFPFVLHIISTYFYRKQGAVTPFVSDLYG